MPNIVSGLNVAEYTVKYVVSGGLYFRQNDPDEIRPPDQKE